MSYGTAIDKHEDEVGRFLMRVEQRLLTSLDEVARPVSLPSR
ncbi:hypothetical protein [Microvirga sp. M2]